MIKNLRLKFGRAPGAPAETIAATPVTVFVGPNNSGKSRLLQEIRQYCTSGQQNTAALLLDRLEFMPFSPAAADAAIAACTLTPQPGEALAPGHAIVGKKGHRSQIALANLKQAMEHPENHPTWFASWYLNFNTLMLDGPGRIQLVNAQGAGDLQMPPHSSFQLLFRDDVKRAEVRRIVHEAFDTHFVIDPTLLGQLRIRLSDKAPLNDLQERGIHEDAVQFHSNALNIELASDGVKAFTGIVTEVIAGDPHVILIDEPEAFLHPALSFKLGNEIARAAVTADKRLFVATHSPSFVMGCLQSGAPVNIVRLSYRSGVATARLLPSDQVLKLMRNPLLRSTSVLSGLFHEFVFVTESDADRAFYQEINERLLRFKNSWGVPNALFLNAQNKQTVQTILAPLRELGIAAAGIVDVDVLKDGGGVWTGLLASAHVPALSHQPLGALRAAVKKAFEDAGKDMKKDGGLSALGGQEAQAANDLFNQLAEYGVFVVRNGELESWLKHLAVPGHGPNWLIAIFEKMGEDPADPGYLKPGDSDVWAFIKDVRNWLLNPQRKGIPS